MKSFARVMKRRDAIKKLGAGALTGVVASSIFSCEEVPQTPTVPARNETIIIVGAGAAGLRTADILASQGFKVTLLEASSRIGGRVHSLRITDEVSDSLMFNPQVLPSQNYPIELGAQFTIGLSSLWGGVVQKIGVPLVDLSSLEADNGYILDQQLQAQSTLSGDSDFVAAHQFIESLRTYSASNVSVQSLLETQGVSPRVHNIVNSIIGNSFGTGNGTLSSLALSEREALIVHDQKLYVPATNPMQDILLSRFASASRLVQLNTKVTAIDYSGEKPVIQIEGSSPLTADCVVVTVPVSILKTGGIAFTPALPSSKSTALARIGMDASIRVSIEFIKNFWLDDAQFLFGGSVVPSYASSAVGRPDADKFLNLTINGPAAESLSAMGPDMIDAILSEMDTTMGGVASSSVAKDAFGNKKMVIKDWTKDPFTKGGNSYTLPGGTTGDREALGVPLSGKVFFAGEATDTLGDFGTISGALRSGERAAQEVIDSFA